MAGGDRHLTLPAKKKLLTQSRRSGILLDEKYVDEDKFFYIANNNAKLEKCARFRCARRTTNYQQQFYNRTISSFEEMESSWRWNSPVMSQHQRLTQPQNKCIGKNYPTISPLSSTQQQKTTNVHPINTTVRLSNTTASHIHPSKGHQWTTHGYSENGVRGYFVHTFATRGTTKYSANCGMRMEMMTTSSTSYSACCGKGWKRSEWSDLEFHKMWEKILRPIFRANGDKDNT